jgi:hypothetical protein
LPKSDGESLSSKHPKPQVLHPAEKNENPQETYAGEIVVLRSLSAALVLAAGILHGETPTPDDPDSILESVRSRMSQYFSQLPNYTCHEVINRVVRPARFGGSTQTDTVELEVAFVGNRELFAHPGASSFEEHPIRALVSTGTIGTGAFAAHVKAVFTAGTFQFSGKGKKDGHQTYRYAFHVSQEKSQFVVRHGPNEAIVEYGGSLWIDSGTLDLVRLEVKSERIPRNLGIDMVQETIRYKPVQIRETSFLLPMKSELVAIEAVGSYHFNAVNLERCREFMGQSIINYEGPSEVSAPR